jgi:hypothetical protein
MLLYLSGKMLGQSTSSSPSKKEMEDARIANAKKAASVQFQYFIIKIANDSYGYSVFADGNLYIQQTTIPAIKGISGFSDTTSAGKVARLVIQKIKNGELPPTVTIEEMKKINVKL